MDVFLLHAKAIPELADLQQECEDSVPGRINFQLPRLGALAGNILSHAVKVLETLFKCWDPLIFKIGWTHHPVWRWNNRMYGYGHAKELWAAMIVFYYSLEPHGPAMLEASLIDRFMGTLVCNERRSFFPCMLPWSSLSPVSQRSRSGKPGCRNIRLGGDTVKEGPTSGGQRQLYMTYVVYRSFKYKPNP